MEIYRWEKFLISRWNLKQRSQLWVVLFGFALTGTTTAKLNSFLFVRLPFVAFGFETPYWIKPITIFLLYPLVLVYIAWLIGEQNFFHNFMRKFYGRFLPKKNKIP